MQLRRAGLAAGLLVVLTAPASGQSAPPEDPFTGRMPEVVAGETLYRLPPELHDEFLGGTLDLFRTGDVGTFFSQFGVDLATVPVTASVNLDVQLVLDAMEAGTLTKEDRLAGQTWATTDMLMVLAIWLGEDAPIDELFDGLAAMFPDSGVNDLTVAGRRIIDLTPALAGDDASSIGWYGLVGVDGILYLLFSMDEEPTLLETVAAIPVLAQSPSPGPAGERPSATATFGPAGSLATARAGHTATLLLDGRVLVIGGLSAKAGAYDFPTAVEAWDPVKGTFGPAGSLVEARYGPAVLLPDGRVLVVGGGGPSGSLASAEVWDPTSGTFAPAGSLAQARLYPAAALLPDGRVLIVGGVDFDVPLASAEIWDPATATFSPAGLLKDARVYHTATTLPDGRVLVIGGAGTDGGDLASAEVWDPSTATFGPSGSLYEGHWELGEARSTHTATLLSDGRVLVVGGATADGEADYLATAEVWDPSTETFAPAGSLSEARVVHTATLLLDGRVLVAGGRGDGEGPVASVEVWDPATATFVPTGSLAKPRFAHSATLLSDGRVLVVGGATADGILASAEVWSP